VGVLVKVLPTDDFFDRRRYEIANGPPLRNPLSDFRRRNIDRSPDRAKRQIGRAVAAVENDEFHQLSQVVDAVPRMESWQIVRADEIKNLSAGIRMREIFNRVDGERGRRAAQLPFIDGKIRFARERSPEHFQPHGSRRRLPVKFVRRERGWDEDNLLEFQLFKGLARENQVGMMDRIKGAAVYADFVQAPER
jgi:hypothetical protein